MAGMVYYCPGEPTHCDLLLKLHVRLSRELQEKELELDDVIAKHRVACENYVREMKEYDALVSELHDLTSKFNGANIEELKKQYNIGD